MEINQKMYKQFDDLTCSWEKLKKNPNAEELAKVKGELQQFLNEVNNLH